MEKETDIKVSEDDMNMLKNQVRLLHGLQPIEAPSKSTPTSPLQEAATILDEDQRTRRTTAHSITPRLNLTHFYRTECVKKRLRQQDKISRIEETELQKMRRINSLKKPADYFKLNKAFHMRWKNIRGLPVVHSHFRETFLDTGKPPFVVPVHYKPFNVYWDADWAKQEFIFLDAAAEEKKKEEAKRKEEERKEEERKKISEIMEGAPYRPKFKKESKESTEDESESSEIKDSEAKQSGSQTASTNEGSGSS